MNNQPTQPINQELHETRKRRMTAVAWVILIALVAFDVFSTRNYIAQRTSPLLFAMLLSYAASIAVAICTQLLRQDRVDAGAWVLIGTTLISLFLSPLLGSGLGYIYGITAVILTFIIAQQGLEKRLIRLAMTIGIGSGVGTIILDALLPKTTTNPNSSFTYIVLFLMMAALLGAIARQAWRGSLRNKLLVGITLSVIVAVGLLASIDYYNNQRNLTTSAGTALKSLADSQAADVASVLREEIHVLQSFGLSKIVQDKVDEVNTAYGPDQTGNLQHIQELDQQWRAADKADNNNDPLVNSVVNSDVASELREFKDTFPENVEVFVTDKYGANIAATNRTSDYYQADEDWWQAAYNNGKGAVYFGQPEYDDSSKTFGVILAIPIVSHGTNEVTGVLRTTINIKSIIDILNTNLLNGTAHTDLYIPGGQALAPEDKATGLRPSDPEALKRLAALTSNTPYDTFNLDGLASVVSATSLSSTDPQLQTAFKNLNWVFLVDQTQADNLAPIRKQLQSIVVISLIILALSALIAVLLAQVLSNPIVRLTEVAEQIAAGNIETQANVETSDEIGKLALTFNSMTTQLRNLIDSLEQRVADRTHNLELAAEVGRSVSQVRELSAMLKDACDLILKEFNLYYVQVYLVNPSRTTLTLAAGTGTVGTQLLARGHSLPLNINSINGRTALEKESVVISDTTQSATFRPNALLPNTRSEMAVPLIVADQVVGVLDMQSREAGTLTQEILPAFEALAGQLAVAIQNATLLAETEHARAQVEAQARRLVQQGWREHLDAIHKPEQIGYVFEHNQVTTLTDFGEIQADKPENIVAAPITVTGESLGSLVVELDNQTRAKQSNELINIVARQVAQQIENLRLLESAERYRSESERVVKLQTIEGWQNYLESRSAEHLGFLYDTKEVRRQINGNGHNEDGSLFTLPLTARDEKIGKLAVQGLQQNDQDAVALANAVAERLSAHIESLRLFEETRFSQLELDNRAKQLAAVAEISTASSKELDVQKMLETVVNLTQRQFDLYHAHVFMYNELTDELQVAACGWEEGSDHTGAHETVSIPLNKEQSLVARAARTKQAVIVNDVQKEEGWLPNPLLPHTASEMAVPLVVGDQVLGVLDVQAQRINAFTEEDANIQTTLASQVATALQNARSFARAQQQAARESALNVISQKIQSATTVEAVLQIAARELGHALGAPMTVAQLSMKDKA